MALSSQGPARIGQSRSGRLSTSRGALHFFQGTGNFHLRIVASLGADRRPDVRFTPKADKVSGTSERLLCANSDRTQRSKKIATQSPRRPGRAAFAERQLWNVHARGCRSYSGLMPANLITLANFSV